MKEPHWSAILRDLLTSFGIIIGALWAFWKWKVEKEERAAREIPALDGELSADVVAMDASNAIITVSVIWRNPGPLPIELDPKSTLIELYEVDDGFDAKGKIIDQNSAALSLIETSFPQSALSRYILEPATDSTMREHLSAKLHKVYLIYWKIHQLRKDNGAVRSWERSFVLDLRKREEA